MNTNYSLYIHIPFCVSKCSYCDFFSIPLGRNCKNSILDEYLDALENEIKQKINKTSKCVSIFIGGGTPSLLTENQLIKIKNIIEEYVLLEKNAEFTIECNPDDISKVFLLKLKEIGVNRISCGIQSLNNEVLKSVKRRAGEVENLFALETISSNWSNIKSFDLISSLPGETESSFMNGLKKVVSYKPQHISLYSLTIEDETPLGEDLNSGKLEYDFDAADEMWIKGRDYLISKGYIQYEVSNFCLPGFECKHNLAYWQHKSYIGVGCGATGTIYNEDTAIRSTNLNKIDNYIDYWLKNNKNCVVEETEFIDRETNEFEFFMMGLRTIYGVSRKNYEEIFKSEFPEHINQLFLKWQNEKLASIETKDSDVIFSLNKEGLLFLNSFLEQLQL